MSGEQAVILFHTSSHALRAEHVLAQRGIAAKLIPVPRHLSSDCGVCLRIGAVEQERAVAVISAARVTIVGIHQL